MSVCVGENLTGQEGEHWMDIGEVDKPNQGDEDVNAVQSQQRQRPNQQSRSESDHERQPCNRQAAVPTPSVAVKVIPPGRVRPPMIARVWME